MPVIGNTRVMPDSLNALWGELTKNADAAGLR
jgi:hypothetical protein